MFETDDNDFDFDDIDNLLEDEGAATSTANGNEGDGNDANKGTESNETNATKDVSQTKAFARRLSQERDKIAKQLGYDNYEALQKARDNKIIEDKGYDATELNPIVDELVKKRLAEDPDMLEVKAYKQQRAKEWAKEQLKELRELTDGKISKKEDIPKDVLADWRNSGSLKASYLALHGEELIKGIKTDKAINETKGDTSHLDEPAGNPEPSTKAGRPYTDEEKRVYKIFHKHVTDEQLNKLRKPL